MHMMFFFQEKKKRRKTAAEMREALGDAAPPKPVPHTTESLRAPDVTAVEEGDEEVNFNSHSTLTLSISPISFT